MPPAGFEPAIPSCKRPQTHALHPAATGIDSFILILILILTVILTQII